MGALVRSLFLAAAAAAVLAASASAQAVKTFGVIAGVNFSTFSGSDADLSSIGMGKESLAGLIGGLFVDIPVGASVSLEPAAMYIGKGANYTFVETGFSGDLTFDLEYIEIPVLLRYNFGSSGGPYALIGPDVAFNISCSAEVTGEASFPKTDCVEIGTLAGIPFDANSVTFGGIVGLGYQHQRIGLEGRYEFDFSDAFKDAGSVKNAAWEILLRYAFK